MWLHVTSSIFFFFNDTATTEIYTLSLHDALPISERESDPIALTRRYLDGADIVLVEGFKSAPLPKIEVYRLAAGPEPLFDPAVHDPGDWVAMVTDAPSYRADFPVFRFSDTAWLVTLANLAWDRAKILPP